MKAVNVLLIVGFTLPIVTVMLQTALAYLYFRFGHAWSRVLNKYVGMSFGNNHNPVWEENPLYEPARYATRSTTRLQRSRTVTSTVTKLKQDEVESYNTAQFME